MCFLLCVSVAEKENKRQRTLVAPRVPRGRTLEHNAFAVVVPTGIWIARLSTGLLLPRLPVFVLAWGTWAGIQDLKYDYMKGERVVLQFARQQSRKVKWICRICFMFHYFIIVIYTWVTFNTYIRTSYMTCDLTCVVLERSSTCTVRNVAHCIPRSRSQ